VSTSPRSTGGGWIGVDLDGTLAHYDHYRGEEFVGEPIDPMVKRVRKWIAEGKDVRLFTARKPHPAVKKWMQDHLGKVLKITNTKDQHMQVLYDDRVVQVKRNKGETRPEDEQQVWEK
jgi:hypothetical protein